MKQYLDAVQDVLTSGQRSPNRTGTDTLFKHGLYMTFDLADGFPAVTTKQLAWKSCFAEMLGFWRGLNNAADFRQLGTRVWDQNANANQKWLKNPNRKGIDDIGLAYGVQARDWTQLRQTELGLAEYKYDQLRYVYSDLRRGIDNRREIVTHWNPGELDQMALPPCHLLYQFGLRQNTKLKNHPFVSEEDNKQILDLFVYIRSNDMGLGMPFNIAGYAWLLSVMAQITGHVPGTLHYFAWNYHIYVNHIEQLREQLQREPRPLPTLALNPDIKTLEDMDTWVTVKDFSLQEYDPHPPLKMEMAV